METIKAFYKDEKGYYCQPDIEKFYYEEGKTYTVPKNKVKLREFGFHASANYDISEAIDYYLVDFNEVYYGIVDLNVVDSDGEESVGDIITIIKFLPQDFDILSRYDKTGEWIYLAARYCKWFNYKKGFERLLEVDKTGEWICYAGCDWEEFDYKKGFERLLEIDKTGEWTCMSGIDWKEFDYKKGLEKLLEVDKIGEWICWAGNDWKEFNYKKALKKLLEIDTKDRYTSAAKINWMKNSEGLIKSEAS